MSDRRSRQRRRNAGKQDVHGRHTAPQTTITGGPTGTTNDATPTFEVTSSEAGSTFECRLDSGDFASCSSAHTTAALGDGPHTLQARPVDAAGNADATPASRTFTVDTAAPQTTIAGGPTGATNDTTPSFEFSSSEADWMFECRVDSAAFASCNSAHATATLTDGPHTFEVRAKDAAGNVDPSPASRTFTVDTAAPQTTITGGPTGATSDATPSFEFSSSEAGSTFVTARRLRTAGWRTRRLR